MSVLSQYKCRCSPRDEYPIDTRHARVLNRTMNDAEITRIMTDAIRTALSKNSDGADLDAAEVDNVRNVLFDVAQAVADEVWPTRSEESPVMPEEWLDAIEGK